MYNEDTGQRLSLPLILKPVTPDAIPVLDRIHTDVRNLEYERITESCSYLRYRPTDHRFLIEKGKVKYQIGDIDSSLHATIETMRYANALSKFILVNCWHVGAHESDAMWSRYTDRNHAIAIKSDAASLVNSLVNRYPDAVGLVQYLSFDREVMPAPHLDMPYWFKRVQFEADRELRVVMDETVYLDTAEHIRTPDFSADICDVGLQYRIDPKILIHEVVLGPGTNEWVVDLVPEPIRIDRGKGDAVYPLRLGQ